MAFNKATAPIYAKGTMDVWVHNPVSGDLEFYSNKVKTDQFTTEVTMGEITGGVGNPVLLTIPDSAKVNLTLTAANTSLEARKLSVGGTLAYNGIIPVMETITAAGTTLSVSETPVAAYGFSDAYAFIDDSGVAYTVDVDTKTIDTFVAVSGQSYCVKYFMAAASAQQLTISSVFSPNVEVVYIRIPAYSAQGTTANQGSKVGDFWIWIPRMQFSGKADMKGDQTDPDTTDISGQALSYDAALAQGICSDSAQSALAYMVYMPLAGATSSVEGLAVVGGGVTVAEGASVQIPVRYVINDELVQPAYADLDYTSSAEVTATVSATGVVTGVLAGSCEVEIELDAPALTTFCNVTVTAP